MKEIKRLEGFLRQAVSLPDEGCPLPGPGGVIPHYQAMRVEKQPREYRYDEYDRLTENKRFSLDLQRLGKDDPEIALWLETSRARLFL